jgi:ABC-type lipoprotein export system ATPase subunit
VQALRDERYYIYSRGLFKIYKIADLEVVALRGLDLEVEQGEIVAIVGASGSGKTTLLNTLAGYDTPSAGQAWVGQRDLLQMKARDAVYYRREEVGFIWQQPSRNLLPYLNAQENVELPLLLLNRSRTERHARSTELLELVGLGDRLKHRPEMLSGGEQQRVAIAVSLANKPPLLLADEPTGELDTHTASDILNVLKDVNQEYGTTIVMVTHDLDVIREIPRVVTIKDGKTSLELVHRPSFREDEDDVSQEFVLVDGSGRLQIPQEYLDQLNIKKRVFVDVQDDKIVVWPEDHSYE